MAAAENPIATGISEALSTDAGEDVVKRTLQAVRAHLGMDVAYVSEFVAGRSVFREVDAPGLEAMVKPGDSYSLDDVYCRHILEGRLPELIPNTANEPVAVEMPITAAIPIGSHVSVPIRLPDGQPYGMFCCLSFNPNETLNERDLQVMRAFADLTAFEINRDLEAAREREEKRLRIAEVIGEEQLSIVYQPIFRLDEGRVIGFECLARFSAEPIRSPDRWFAEAAEIGLAVELELAAIRMALAPLPSFPAGAYLAVNASPQTVVAPQLAALLAGIDPERVVIEITEHESVADYSDLTAALRPLRSSGVRLAVDDAGAGYSSLRHILELAPDFIKLDLDLTRSIDIDPARRALAAALIGFAGDTGSQIIAEGVETASELNILRRQGVDKAQGYFLGRPAPLEEAVRLAGAAAPASSRIA